MKRTKYILAATALFIAGAIAAPHLVRLAAAALVPSIDPLIYTGLLEDDDGPVSGEREIEIADRRHEGDLGLVGLVGLVSRCFVVSGALDAARSRV
jgi:hypothetical protein